MANFLILARGKSLEDARMLAVSAEPSVVDRFIAVLSGEEGLSEERPKANRRGARRLEVVRDGDGA